MFLNAKAIRSNCLTCGCESGSSGRSVVLGRQADRSEPLAPLLMQLDADNASVSALRGLQPVAELRMSELQSGGMKDVIRGSKMGGKDYLLGMERYCCHISVLKGP